MEAFNVAHLPEGGAWRYEPKWDGFRCLARKKERHVELVSKSGKSLTRYFPDIERVLENLSAEHFLLDGELLIAEEGRFSFSALQARLHPAASRVNKLASELPATYVLFDILDDSKKADLKTSPFTKRRKKLEEFHRRFSADLPQLILSPQTASLREAQHWVTEFEGQVDGLIAKNGEDIYEPGERIMQKYKFKRSADCVVGGFRYESKSRLVGSLLLGLYDDEGLLHHVGFTSGLSNEDKPALTKKLEALIKSPGFTGKAPGGPSRWTTEKSAEWEPLKPSLVVEVSFDHVSDNRFRHGTSILRWRPDKSPRQCTMIQLQQPRILPQNA